MSLIRPALRIYKAAGLIVLYWFLAIFVFFIAGALIFGGSGGSDRRDDFAVRLEAERRASAQKTEIDKRRRDAFLASIEGDPARQPMRSNLTDAARRQCEAVWLTPSGRTIRKPDGSLQGFPNEITVDTPHPRECY